MKNFEEKKVDCVVGLFSKENPFTDFFSQYKSLYCNYKYRSIKGTAAINTAIAAIKKDVFQKMGGFNTKMMASEDNELANRLSQNGYKIVVDCDMEVIHLKKFNFFSLMKNDYKKSISLALIFF